MCGAFSKGNTAAVTHGGRRSLDRPELSARIEDKAQQIAASIPNLSALDAIRVQDLASLDVLGADCVTALERSKDGSITAKGVVKAISRHLEGILASKAKVSAALDEAFTRAAADRHAGPSVIQHVVMSSSEAMPYEVRFHFWKVEMLALKHREALAFLDAAQGYIAKAIDDEKASERQRSVPVAAPVPVTPSAVPTRTRTAKPKPKPETPKLSAKQRAEMLRRQTDLSAFKGVDRV